MHVSLENQVRITESMMRRIIREEADRILREGDEGGTLELRFGQPELNAYEESLEITFPYTLDGEEGEEKLDYSDLEVAKGDPEAVLDRFAEENTHLGYRADEELADDDAAIALVRDAFSSSPDFDMDTFRSDLEAIEANRFDAEF